MSLISVLAVTCITGCNRQPGQNRSNNNEKITIAVSSQPTSTAVYVAHAKGYFENEGLLVVIKPYTTGKEALNSVLQGKAQFATVAETPVMLAALNGEKIYIIATIANADKYMKIVARKDKGILAPADLKGKKIGLTSGTTAEFFMHVYLTLNHMTEKEVQIVNVQPDNIVNILVTGKVDAVSTWIPHTTILEQKLENNAVLLSDSSAYTLYWNIAITQEFAKNNPEHIKQFLRGIARATDYIREHPEEAHVISAKYIGADISLYERDWDNFHFALMLDQSLILNMEDQARWMIKQENSTRKLPDFTDFIYTPGLKAINPDAVRIPGE
ncbi:MAG: ABC transporter substrate-binding protein [Armatimonadota bacterium]